MEKYETKFGYFIRQKRLDLEELMMPTDLARLLGVTRKYIEELEKGKIPAPEQEVLVKMAQIFKLDEKEKKLMFELAEKSKEESIQIADTPILDYIDENASVINALKIAREFGATKGDWEEFSQKIKNRKTGHDEI